LPLILLSILFLVVPILEIFVIIQVGQAIGAWPTVLLLLFESALGAWIIRHEGRRAWRSLRGAFETGRLPSRELADAGLVLVGGTLLLTPGFITDIVGFCLLIPPTRALLRGLVARLARRRVAFSWRVATPPPRAGRGPYRTSPRYDYEGTAEEVTDSNGELPPARSGDD
jgi:UPF0716 protein FxsA